MTCARIRLWGVRVRKKLQKLGSALVVMLSRDEREALGVQHGDEVTVETVGDALVIRAADAPEVGLGDLAAQQEAIRATAARRAEDALSDSPSLNRLQRRLVALVYEAPARSGELHSRLGRTREHTARELQKLRAGGWLEKVGPIWRVTEAARSRIEAQADLWGLADLEDDEDSYVLLIDALAGEPRSTSEVAAAAGLERSNAHKRLAALEARGLVERLEGRPVRWRRA